MQKITHMLLIMASFITLFAFIHSPFAIYSPYLFAFLVLISLIEPVIRTTITINLDQDNLLTTAVVIMLILLICAMTGGFLSPFFFLFYFLCFVVSFFLDPTMVIVLIVATLLMFVPDIVIVSLMDSSLRIGSLILMAPLAYVFGKNYREDKMMRQKLEQNRSAL